MRVLDPGHKYALKNMDGEGEQILTFVKRDYPPEQYPGNEGSYPGVLMQEVLRALIDRCEYVNGQFPCAETEAAQAQLQTALLLFEVRTHRKRRTQLKLKHLDIISEYKTCDLCGHLQCEGHS
jgi:hypothetical protein